jgi:hypothetical protein
MIRLYIAYHRIRQCLLANKHVKILLVNKHEPLTKILAIPVVSLEVGLHVYSGHRQAPTRSEALSLG